jgi:hypothetical protein
MATPDLKRLSLLLTLVYADEQHRSSTTLTVASVSDDLEDLEDFVNVAGDPFLAVYAHWLELTEAQRQLVLDGWLAFWTAASEDDKRDQKAAAAHMFG